MAEQKKTNEALNVEEALTQSEAFLIKNKKTIIGVVVAIIVIVAGVTMYKNLYAAPREEKAQAALFMGQQYFESNNFEQALNGDSIGYAGFLKVAEEYSGTKAANLGIRRHLLRQIGQNAGGHRRIERLRRQRPNGGSRHQGHHRQLLRPVG